MQWNVRLQALLDHANPDEETYGLPDLESQLSIAELLLLLQAAAVWGAPPYDLLLGRLFDPKGKPMPLSEAVELPAWTLRELAGQARLRELGMIELRLKEGEWRLLLTPRGMRALDYLKDAFHDLGFRLPEDWASPPINSTSMLPSVTS